jgi:hypothetical protein
MTIYNLPVEYDNLNWLERSAVREQYIKEQKGDCYWCKEPLQGEPPTHITDKKVNRGLFPYGFFVNLIHLQHDHGNGLTEGAVHAYCNAVMWQFHGR